MARYIGTKEKSPKIGDPKIKNSFGIPRVNKREETIT